MENEIPLNKPEENKTPSAQDRIREKIRALEIKQTNSINWTPDDFKNLTRLRETLKNNVSLTPAHQEALHRQGIAGTDNEPPLTPEEIKLIQEANDLL